MSDSEMLENESAVDTNKGLANVMAQILSKSAPRRVILAKSKTERELNEARKKRLSEEPKKGDLEGDDGTVSFTLSKKRKKQMEEDSSSEDEDPIIKRERQQKRKLWDQMGHVKPNVLDKDKEKNLQRIATKGVVQLFNAVKKQQKIVNQKVEEAGPSMRRREQAMKSVSKGQFMDVLKGGAANVVSEGEVISTQKNSKAKPSGQSEDNPTWSILKDSFMMGAKMKDWNKGSDSEDSISDNMSNDSDGD